MTADRGQKTEDGRWTKDEKDKVTPENKTDDER